MRAQELPSPAPYYNNSAGEIVEKHESEPEAAGESRSDYNTQVLRHVQHIFGHLLGSQLQFHTPQGFWKTFKYVQLEYSLLNCHFFPPLTLFS